MRGQTSTQDFGYWDDEEEQMNINKDIELPTRIE